ncbi:bifunctional folylpolyglutamate synthase/dihydrofolate synthase [Alteribacillus iranensis]|uniref:Dihydrofolate synthase/folylpolyglutamate synthase n=1 Tax=Alteribacillus iranensis TaxID=930128 RepID=A0A1I2CPM8_9BACI|nr:folylpolyglutamate synthase/dihydrofolate synthase family protein [Alteribacillus iranensis]SFE70329.1 dihydrofolate synthase / folylpolyglutamate synthase [Alteribacillus iranensis]
MKTYEEAKEWLQQLTAFGIRPGLDRVHMLMEGIGNPERRLKSIHVGGTNGKGSTVAFLREPMKEADLVCGTFTSPYVKEFRERISVNGNPISEADFLESAQAVRPVADSIARTPFGPPTEFEVLTAIAAHHFAYKAFPDIVIWEVGLGGRLDSTNVIHPMISVITNVGHDHQHILGDTIEDIAKEKAGIIKSGVPLVTCETNSKVLDIFEKATAGGRTKMYRIGHEFTVPSATPSEKGWVFSYQSLLLDLEDLEIGMLGRHQTENAAAALMAIRYLMMYYAMPVEEKHIREGFKKASWPGRLEKRDTQPMLLLDGAHNREGMESLATALRDHFPNKTIHLITAMTKEKDPSDLLSVFRDIDVGTCTAVTFHFDRAAEAEAVAEKSPIPQTAALPDWESAWKKVQSEAAHDDIVVAAGSLYFISEIIQHLDG